MNNAEGRFFFGRLCVWGEIRCVGSLLKTLLPRKVYIYCVARDLHARELVCVCVRWNSVRYL